MQFKKFIASLDLSCEDKATTTIFVQLDNDAYGIFDGMLMNLHLSPFSACTNLALQATIDLLIQQAVLGQVSSAGSPVPSAFANLAINSSALPPDNSAPAVASASSPPVLQSPAIPSSAPAPATPINPGSVVHNAGNSLSRNCTSSY